MLGQLKLIQAHHDSGHGVALPAFAVCKKDFKLSK
jgi:hypothetical protein